jgi:ribonucleoside-diphosphate reductase alpha chain
MLIKRAGGSIQDIDEIPEDRTVWELPMRALVHMAAARGPYPDQSQSLKLFIETPTIGKLSSMYLYAWEQGLKTTYYLRSRPATRIRQATVSGETAFTPASAKGASSADTPEICEACQ